MNEQDEMTIRSHEELMIEFMKAVGVAHEVVTEEESLRTQNPIY